MKKFRLFFFLATSLTILTSTGAHAKDEISDPRTQDWFTIGVGVIAAPTYSGSDKSDAIIGGAVMGRVEGFYVMPRVAGVAVDLIRDDTNNVSLTFGPSLRARFNRTSKNLKDPVVESLDKLDTALETGFVLGVGFNKVLHEYDRVDVGVDVRWDIAGAHDGMIISPTIAYQTPLSRGTAVQLAASAEYQSGKTSRYYWSVSPQQSAISGLPLYRGKSDLNSMSVLGLGIIDLNGNLADGGFAVYVGGGYQRLMGSADKSPITRIRGDSDQFYAGIGIGYTFF